MPATERWPLQDHAADHTAITEKDRNVIQDSFMKSVKEGWPQHSAKKTKVYDMQAGKEEMTDTPLANLGKSAAQKLVLQVLEGSHIKVEKKQFQAKFHKYFDTDSDDKDTLDQSAMVRLLLKVSRQFMVFVEPEK